MIVVPIIVPAVEPITKAELKLHLRLDSTSELEDDLLDDIIHVAREIIEDFTRRALLTQTWDMYLDSWPAGDAIKIPFGNLQSVTHVKYTDTDDTQATMTGYTVETNGEQCGRVVLPYGGSWPSAALTPSNPIVIQFVAGWATAADLPSKIKVAVKMICHDLYENRESQVFATGVNCEYLENKTVSLLLASMRLMDAVW